MSGSTIAQGSSVFQGVVQGPLPGTFVWRAGASGDWGTESDWSGGVVPDGTSNAKIVGVKTETVTVSENEAVNALTINDAQATLAVTNGATLSVYGDFVVAAVHAIDITQGTLFLGGSGQLHPPQRQSRIPPRRRRSYSFGVLGVISDVAGRT